MNSDANKNDGQTGTLGRIGGWAVGVVAIGVIIVVGWRTIAGLRETARPHPAAENNAPPATAARTEAGSANWSAKTFKPQASDAVRQTSERSWSVKGGRAFMQVRRLDNDSLEVRFVYPLEDILPAETNALIRTRWSLGPAEPLVRELNITAEQMARLQSISPVTDIQVHPSDRQRLTGLFREYVSGSDATAAEKALVEAVADLDARYYDSTMQLIGNIAVQVRQLFSEEQRAGLMKRFGTTKDRQRSGREG